MIHNIYIYIFFSSKGPHLTTSLSAGSTIGIRVGQDMPGTWGRCRSQVTNQKAQSTDTGNTKNIKDQTDGEEEEEEEEKRKRRKKKERN